MSKKEKIARVIIAGGRDFNDYDLLNKIKHKNIHKFGKKDSKMLSSRLSEREVKL